MEKSSRVQPGKVHRMRWGVERRLEFIEFRLHWDGKINRSDLTTFFGISVPQASADLTKYQELAPENLYYDKSAKYYVSTEKFRPLFLSPDSERYFRELRSLSNGLIEREDSFAGWIPDFDTTPTLERSVSPDTLHKILAAIRDKMKLHTEYQSMSRPDPMWRWISPHALGFDGFRWHVRAYCHTRHEFRDFLFSRILSISDGESSSIDELSDREWHEFVTIRIGPHPGLEDNLRRVTELDYEMENGEKAISVRGALFFYLARRLGLSKNSEAEPPKSQHIVPLNWDEAIMKIAELKRSDKDALRNT